MTLKAVGTVPANVDLSVGDDNAAPAAAAADVSIAAGRHFSSHDIVFADNKIHNEHHINSYVNPKMAGMKEQ